MIGQKLWSTVRTLVGNFVFFLVCFMLGGFLVVQVPACSSSAQSAKAAKVESDLCKARAAYKLFAAAAGGRLDPAPGSPRAELEAAEDELCASRSDAGS